MVEVVIALWLEDSQGSGEGFFWVVRKQSKNDHQKCCSKFSFSRDGDDSISHPTSSLAMRTCHSTIKVSLSLNLGWSLWLAYNQRSVMKAILCDIWGCVQRDHVLLPGSLNASWNPGSMLWEDPATLRGLHRLSSQQFQPSPALESSYTDDEASRKFQPTVVWVTSSWIRIFVPPNHSM